MSSTDSPDDLKKGPPSKTPEEIARDQKYDPFFSTDLDLITRTIRSDRQYKDKIEPQVILRFNVQAHTMKWTKFTHYITDLDDTEHAMTIMYYNIFYKNNKIHRLLNKGLNTLENHDFDYVVNWQMAKLRLHVERVGDLFVGENLYR